VDPFSGKHFSLAETSLSIERVEVFTMTKSKELILGIQHIRINWFSFRLQYLKALIKISSLIGELSRRLRK